MDYQPNILKDVYKMYTIRCKTCNGQIGCFAPEYEQMIESDTTREDALDNLGLTDYCCRQAMMNPSYIRLAVENRNVVEGIVDASKPTKMQGRESLVSPQFPTCIGEDVSKLEYPKRLGAVGKTLSVVPGTRKIKKQDAGIPDLDVLELGEVVESKLPKETKLEDPTMVGIPVIGNVDIQRKEYVGVEKYCGVLSGRSYLAR